MTLVLYQVDRESIPWHLSASINPSSRGSSNASRSSIIRLPGTRSGSLRFQLCGWLPADFAKAPQDPDQASLSALFIVLVSCGLYTTLRRIVLLKSPSKFGFFYADLGLYNRRFLPSRLQTGLKSQRILLNMLLKQVLPEAIINLNHSSRIAELCERGTYLSDVSNAKMA